MNIRRFRESDIHEIVSLFYETVHTVNKQHYSQVQLDAWAPKAEESLKREAWKESLNRNITFIAEDNSKLIGFADMTKDGHLDRLYIHKDYQRQGIASTLVNSLEYEARVMGLNEMSTDASITAKPFFEHLGYLVDQSQIVERNGVQLANFRMTKML